MIFLIKNIAYLIGEKNSCSYTKVRKEIKNERSKTFELTRNKILVKLKSQKLQQSKLLKKKKLQ